MKRKLAIVLLSGGMDSCVCAAIAHRQYELAFLHISYGQLTESQELNSFHKLSKFYKIEKLFICKIDSLRQIGGSSLTDSSISVEKGDLERQDIPNTYVPFRNAHFLSIATSWAEVIGAEFIFIGAVEEDSSGYPDCRPEYYQVFNQLIEVGTKSKPRVEIVTPVIKMSKKEIVTTGVQLGSPLHLTWACYKDQDVACGKCDSCLLRKRGFQAAGVEDQSTYLL